MDKYEAFHANQTSMCPNPLYNSDEVGNVKLV